MKFHTSPQNPYLLGPTKTLFCLLKANKILVSVNIPSPSNYSHNYWEVLGSRCVRSSRGILITIFVIKNQITTSIFTCTFPRIICIPPVGIAGFSHNWLLRLQNLFPLVGTASPVCGNYHWEPLSNSLKILRGIYIIFHSALHI